MFEFFGDDARLLAGVPVLQPAEMYFLLVNKNSCARI
jgi:hypothetical protein